MKRQITGLNAADRCAADQVPDGVFLVRVQRVQFRRQIGQFVQAPVRRADRWYNGCVFDVKWKFRLKNIVAGAPLAPQLRTD